MKRETFLRLAKLFNPFVVLLYGTLCKYLADLAMYGNMKYRVPIIAATIILLIIWFVYKFIQGRKEPFGGYIDLNPVKLTTKEKWVKSWSYFAIFLLLLITILTGYTIYMNGHIGLS